MEPASRPLEAAAVSRGQWSLASLRALLEGLPDAVVAADARGAIVLANPLAEELFGLSRDELIGRRVELLWPERLRARFNHNMSVALALERPLRIALEVHGLRADGSEFEGEMSWGVVETDEGRLILAIGRDVTDHREADRRLERYSRQHAVVAALGQRALSGADPTDLMREAEERVADVLGAAAVRVLQPDDPSPGPGAIEVDLAAAGARLGRLAVVPARAASVGEEERAFLVAVANVLASAAERSAGEARMRHQALHDSLTGLANRTLCRDRLEHALARADRGEGCAAVLALDVDGFKRVNDLHGHAVGDEVLVALGQRLVAAVRPSDTVARIGGDEFVVVCDTVDERAAIALAERVALAVRRPLQGGGTLHELTVSVGVALAEDGNADPDRLVADADAAAYRAKSRGRGNVELFDERLRRRVRNRARLEAGLEDAVARGELSLALQPIVHLRDGSVAGHEALLRWDRGGSAPSPPVQEIITLAEESGLIVRLGAWALREACRMAAERRQAAPAGGLPWVSVNVSARQLAEPGLTAVVREALEESGLPARALRLEITETMLLEAGGAALETIQALGRLGVGLGLDDFGTGWSSLQLLRRLPVTMLKIDRSFVRGVALDSADAAIVKAIVSMSVALGIEAVGEGVEERAQALRLRALGCPLAQGFLFGAPE